MKGWNTAWNTRRADVGSPEMLNDFAARSALKTPAGILSLLRMPFRQGALVLVFQAVFQLFLGEPFAARGVA